MRDMIKFNAILQFLKSATFLGFLLSISQAEIASTRGQSTSSEDLSLKAWFGSDDIIPFEPLVVYVSLENKTDKAMTGYFPKMRETLNIEASNDGGRSFQVVSFEDVIPWWLPAVTDLPRAKGLGPRESVQLVDVIHGLKLPEGKFHYFIEQPGEWILRIAYFRQGRELLKTPSDANLGLGEHFSSRLNIDKATVAVTLTLTVRSLDEENQKALIFLKEKEALPWLSGKYALTQDSVAPLEQAVRQFSSSRFAPWGRFVLAEYFQSRDFQKSLEYFRSVVNAEFPFEEQALFDSIWLAFRMNEREQGEKWRQVFIKRFPKSPLLKRLPTD